MDSHDIVSDSDAEEETLNNIKYGHALPKYLKRKRKGGPVTRTERTSIITKAQRVNIRMKQIYEHFGKLCIMLEKEGFKIPHGIMQDIHEHVFEPLCKKMLCD